MENNINNIRENDRTVTVFDAGKPPYTLRLSDFGKSSVTFGRNPADDIVLTSPLVTHSKSHGAFVFENGCWSIVDNRSTNGIIFNNRNISSKQIDDGDLIRIDDGVESVAEGVLFVFSAAGSANRWFALPLTGKSKLTVGRDERCDIVLPHISVSKRHAEICLNQYGFTVSDCGKSGSVILNGRSITGPVKLHEKDVITISNSKLIFTNSTIYYCCFNSGISVDASDIVIRRGKGRSSFITSNHVSLNIKPGELVAVIGGSGAGKSTILNCMCGYLKPTKGEVYINGIDLYRNFDSLKKLIGYVPQSDIVYDNLTLRDMLMYTAKLRLPDDTTAKEREDAIDRAIATVELSEKKKSYIKALSGGQRKRASIAVELLSDPNLLFLDEPSSGLDPGTERSLMQSLRGMADSGKTVILVTHSTLQLKMCDKIVFMGKGGNLCFFGSYDDALKFFGVSDVIDIYNMITEDSPGWSAKFEQTRNAVGKTRKSLASSKKIKENKLRQLRVLSSRYLKLILNDRQRLILLLAQAPLLAVLISFVSDGTEFTQYEMTKSLLFALSCSAFWVGMLNAIQEICKERSVLKREYMTGLSLGAYISSKIIVLGLMCLIQSFLITVVFGITVGLPSTHLIFPPFIELFITTFLTAVASAAMGLFVSSLFTNADRAMTVAPILLMPQILFSGLIFELSGPTEGISWLAVCRWSMEGYGSTANLNDLDLKLQTKGILIPHAAENFYKFTRGHLLFDWAILVVFTVVFLLLARAVLGKISKESA